VAAIQLQSSHTICGNSHYPVEGNEKASPVPFMKSRTNLEAAIKLVFLGVFATMLYDE
jgi:hypothetical protein